jgi:hypothetical protein
MHVILKWNGISKFCEWNFNSLDFVAIIKKKAHFMRDIKRARLYSDTVCWYTCRCAWSLQRAE